MTKKEMVLKILKDKGVRPEIDSDGDIFFKWEMKTIYFTFGEDDEPYSNIILAPFAKVDEDNAAASLIICNKLTRELKVAKVYANPDLDTISASYQFMLTDEENGKMNIDFALSIFSVLSSLFARETMKMEEADNEESDSESQEENE